MATTNKPKSRKTARRVRGDSLRTTATHTEPGDIVRLKPRTAHDTHVLAGRVAVVTKVNRETIEVTCPEGAEYGVLAGRRVRVPMKFIEPQGSTHKNEKPMWYGTRRESAAS